MFGKLMSASDELMWRYFELLSFRPMSEIEGLKKQVEEGANPRDIKMQLADEIIIRFHSARDAGAAKDEFINRFRHGQIPDEMPEIEIQSVDGGVGIAQVLKQSNLTSSTSEAFRMIKQGAVKVDGEKISDRDTKLGSHRTYIVQVGKRKFTRVKLI